MGTKKSRVKGVGISIEGKKDSDKVMINIDTDRASPDELKQHNIDSRKSSLNRSVQKYKMPNMTLMDRDSKPTILASSIPIVDNECLFSDENDSPKVNKLHGNYLDEVRTSKCSIWS